MYNTAIGTRSQFVKADTNHIISNDNPIGRKIFPANLKLMGTNPEKCFLDIGRPIFTTINLAYYYN